MDNITQEQQEQIKAQTKEIYKEIYQLIGHDEDACKFVLMYGNYVEMIDDIIDESHDGELVLKAFSHAMLMFTTPFWLKWHEQLLLVDALNNNQYADSLIWEKSEDSWKREDARCLSHCGYNILYAVIYLVAGRDALRKVSERFRQWSHMKHRLDKH